MKSEFALAFNEITERFGLSRDTVMQALEAAMVSAYRRSVNASSAQPLLENAAAAEWSMEPATPLVRLRLEVAIQGVHPHEATVFLKNPSLAVAR